MASSKIAIDISGLDVVREAFELMNSQIERDHAAIEALTARLRDLEAFLPMLKRLYGEES